MPSVCVACICFTLEGRNPEDNPQTSMFLLWLSKLISKGGLQADDKVCFLTDVQTLEYLKSETIFDFLVERLPCELHVLVQPQPKTCLEGCMWKQEMIPQEQDVFFYCDIDILCLRSIHGIVDTIPENTFVFHVEGPLRDPNQGAALTESQRANAPEHSVGISAGKFLIRGKEGHLEFIQKINQIAAEHAACGDAVIQYTLEQPYFNRALLELSGEAPMSVNVQILSSAIQNVLNDMNDATILFDLMGEPGNGTLHLQKMLQMFAYLETERTSAQTSDS